jgi:uncharacterized protein YecT (DUF1311 family)
VCCLAEDDIEPLTNSMARSVTSPAEQKRRRDIMAAAIERARAARLAHEAKMAAAPPPQNTAPGASSHVNGSTPMPASETKVAAWIREHGNANKMTVMSHDERAASRARVYVVKCGVCNTDIRAVGVAHLLQHVASAAHVATRESGRAPETAVNAWIREHGDANTMSLVSNDDMSASGTRVRVVKCGACKTEIRVAGVRGLQIHVDSAAHVAALDSGRAPENKVDAWIREHSDANTMSLVSKDEMSNRHRVYVVKCGACRTEIRATALKHLLDHVDSATHVAALESGRAPETAVNAWIREHGDANTMSLVSNDEMTASGKRVHIVKCGACRKEIRAVQLKPLLNHIDSATHVAALESGREPEHKVVAWIRDHGDANKMGFEMVLNAKGKRTWNVDCGTCGKKLRVTDVGHLEKHVDCATHVSAFKCGRTRHMAALDSKTERLALRKRPRC